MGVDRCKHRNGDVCFYTMKKMLILRGAPGAGKSTWAKSFVQSNPDYKRVNRDELRWMTDGPEVFDRSSGPLVTKVQTLAIRTIIEEGHNVVVDNTHLVLNDVKALHILAQDIGDIEVSEKCFTTHIDECKKRNLTREGIKRVPDSVMDGFAKLAKRAKLVDSTIVYPPRPTSSLIPEFDSSIPSAVICDLDGTLALMNGRDPYNASTCYDDLPNDAVVTCLMAMHAKSFMINGESSSASLMYGGGHHIIFCSGREDKYRDPTLRFLERNCQFLFESTHQHWQLHMRKTGDSRKDSIVKREMYDEHIRGKFNVAFVLDDRNCVVDVWRSLGLSCFQVNPGAF